MFVILVDTDELIITNNIAKIYKKIIWFVARLFKDQNEWFDYFFRYCWVWNSRQNRRENTILLVIRPDDKTVFNSKNWYEIYFFFFFGVCVDIIEFESDKKWFNLLLFEFVLNCTQYLDDLLMINMQLTTWYFSRCW